MSTISRLLSFADTSDPAGKTVNVSVLHQAELVNGKLVLLLNDRGWSSSARWSDAQLQDVYDTARVVVGPDEPYGAESIEDTENGHWSFIQEVLARQGIAVDIAELRKTRHDVVLSERLKDRLGSRINPSG